MAIPDPKRRPSNIPNRPALRKPMAGAGAPAPKNAAPRRRYAPKPSGGSDGMERIMIRIGVVLFVGLIGFIARSATAHPAGDQKYFNAVVDLTRTLDKGIVVSRESIRRQISELPIDGVSDPKLKEMHQVLLQLLSVSPGDDAKAEALGNRFDQLVDELNRKYAR